MRGDFSRLVLDPDHYGGVLMQQGRVLLDSDWNTSQAILIAAQRALAKDLIGPHGGPADADFDGFSITDAPDGGEGPDLTIGPGIYYVDGIRIENSPDPAPGNGALWSAQPFPPFTERQALPEPPYLVYLDVWERHVTALEDDTLREVALGGPDTTSRTQVVWQVRIDPYSEEAHCHNFPLQDWRDTLAGNPPRMRARTGTPPDNDDPCLAAPHARYRGVENQLYRVEIADVSPGGASFVWSRENGSVSAAWTGTEDNDLHVTGVRDTVHGFAPGDWVELTWNRLEVAGQPGTRARISATDGLVVTIDPTTASGDIESDPSSKPGAKVRRWDHRQRKEMPLIHGAIPITESNDPTAGWMQLEDGIEVQFAPPADGAAAHTYRVGDYWTIPARVATGDIIWPKADGTPVPKAPVGVVHHYAPLAWREVPGAAPVDLRRKFGPLAACRVVGA
ncbi:DUF6519 domain-containing protein [Rhodococcus aetherivorans]|uniref:DUF6519 domain-containing protein n=1 Tax=Rhodococcus aetherivorans TaxID=191292 RepID=UPI00366E048C